MTKLNDGSRSDNDRFEPEEGRALPVEGDGSQPLANPTWERFARAAVILSQVEAFQRCYPRSRCWMKTSAYVMASRLAARVAPRINYLRKRYMERYDATAANVIKELCVVAFSELPGIVGVEGGRMTATDFEVLTPEQRRCIKRVRFMTVGRDPDGNPIEGVEYELWDKLKALELLSKHHRLLGEDKASGMKTVQIYMDMGGERPRFQEPADIMDEVAKEVDSVTPSSPRGEPGDAEG